MAVEAVRSASAAAPQRGNLMRRNSFYASAAALALIVPATAHGQVAPGDQPATVAATQATRTTVYDAAFFAQFAPRSALDIARRVPGFALDLGNNDNGQDIRGFAGVAGNVVINGARPSSKAESLETLLQRIPAQRVPAGRSRARRSLRRRLFEQEPGAEHHHVGRGRARRHGHRLAAGACTPARSCPTARSRR